MAPADHLHRVARWHGVWACTDCSAAWQRYRMIPAGSLVSCGVFRIEYQNG